jgi:hypothetical protein
VILKLMQQPATTTIASVLNPKFRINDTSILMI